MMGTSFSALDKHGGCYNFGMNLGSRASSRKNANQWLSSTALSSSVHSACNACRILASAEASSGCHRELHLVDPMGSTHHWQFGRESSSSFHTDTVLSMGSPDPSQPTSSDFQIDPVPSSCQNDSRRSSSRASTIQAGLQREIAIEDTVIVREPVLVSSDGISELLVGEQFINRNTLSTPATTPKQRTAHNSKVLDYLNGKMNVNEVTRVYVSQFSSLLQSWSFDELYRLQNQFEALELLRSITVTSGEARQKAPTLDDDLRSLCTAGWCHNMQVSYGKVVCGAHSYILSTRSPVFSKVLHAAYRSLFDNFRKTSFLPTMSILVPSLDESKPESETSHTNVGSVPFQNSPDVLRSTSVDTHQQKLVRDFEPGSRGSFIVSPTSAVESKKTHRNRRAHKTPQSLVFEQAVCDFLVDLYAGCSCNPLSLLLEEQHQQDCSPTKPKPDLLCLPDNPARISAASSGSDLSSLYRAIDFTHPESPLAPDCRLTFSCEHSPCKEAIHIKCHAGLLAARSQFLRRILLRRYVPHVGGSSGGGSDLTSVGFDGTLMKSYFARILVHFFYSDRLDLNAIATIAQPRSTLASTVVSSVDTGLNGKHDCNLMGDSVDTLHTHWHTAHNMERKQLPCCIGKLKINDELHTTLDSHSRTTSKSSDSKNGMRRTFSHVHTQQDIKFCLYCPYCMARVLELHPVGQYLEFPRLSEACEDLVIQALSLPTQTNVLKNDDLHKELSESSFHERPDILKMTRVSLAVGLLHWAKSSSTKLSPISSSVESVASPMATTQQDSATIADENVHKDRPAVIDANGQSLNRMASTDTGLDESNLPMRYLYLQAMQCLRDNFMFLVRSPSVLGRLSPKELRELLDSSLVQAPESEVLAALLCWAEQRIRTPPDRHGMDESKLSTYSQLVFNIVEQPHLSHSVHNYEINPWLLLGLSQDEDYSRLIETATENWSGQHTVSAMCDLCHAIEERNSRSQENVSFDPVNLEAMVKKLHRHRLLEFIRPTHLLTPVPLGLATLILQYHLGVTKKSQLSSGSPLIPAKLPIDSPLLGLATLDPRRFYRWAPLLTTSMMLLPHSLPSKDEKMTSLHPILSSKLGNGPLSIFPPSSPAQVSSKNAWFTTTQQDNHVMSVRHFRTPCTCRWANQATRKDGVEDSSSAGYSTKLTPVTQLNNAPRLFRPFHNELRVLLNSRSLSSTPIRRPTTAGDSEPRCTCLRLLSTLSTQCTPTHFPMMAIQRGTFDHLPTTYHDQQSIHAREAAITVSPQNASSTIDRCNPCCNSNCADFSHCLLQPQQWTTLVNRYLELLEQFERNHSSPWNCLDPNQLCLLYRLQVLREQGLPDNLQTLLACRINERLCEHSQDVDEQLTGSSVTQIQKPSSVPISSLSEVSSSEIDASFSLVESYGSMDPPSLLSTPAKEALIFEDKTCLPVNSHSQRYDNASAISHFVKPKNDLEPSPKSYECLACQTGSGTPTLLNALGDRNRSAARPRCSTSKRNSKSYTTALGTSKHSNSSPPCLCDKFPYQYHTSHHVAGKQNVANEHPSDKFDLTQRIARRSCQRASLQTDKISAHLLVPPNLIQQTPRSVSKPKHKKQPVHNHLREISCVDISPPRCSCPYLISSDVRPSPRKPASLSAKYTTLYATKFRKDCSQLPSNPYYYYTVRASHTGKRRSPPPPLVFTPRLSSSYLSTCSKSTSDLSESLSLGDLSTALDATD